MNDAATVEVDESMLNIDELLMDEWEGEGEELGGEFPEQKAYATKEEIIEDSDKSLIAWAANKFLNEDDFELVDRSDSSLVMQARSSTSSINVAVNKEEKLVEIEGHGYTFIEFNEIDEQGNKKSTRKFLPRVHRKIRTFKKLVPIKVVFNKLLNDNDIVEEEEEVDEEAEVDEYTDTILIRKRDEDGREYFEEKLYVYEVIKDPNKKKWFIKLNMENDLGEIVEELIELNNDKKRTNDIKRLAAPYLRRKTKILDKKAVHIEGYDDKSHEKTPISSLPDWTKPKEPQRDLVKMKMIGNLKKAREEQKALKEMNNYLVKKLSEYYDLKGPKTSSFLPNEGGNTEEEKVKYHKRLLEFNDVVNFILAENKVRAEKISQAEADTQLCAEQLKKEKDNMYALEEAMLLEVDPAEEAKTLRAVTFRDLINQQKAMDQSLAKVRLDFIRSQIRLKDLQDKKASHQLAIDNMEKVDFINYESLKVMTKDLNDILDLKEKQVFAMKDRLTQRVQALAHIRLKSDSLTAENEKLKNETKDIINDFNALRKDCLHVQQQRRRFERALNNVTMKEGINKYPYLIPEVAIVESKNRAQVELLGRLADACSNIKEELKLKLADQK